MLEPSADPAGRPLAELDPLIHAPARLMLVTTLYVVESADFTFLAQHTGLSSGNLSTHLTRLEESGYVRIEKSFRGRRPQTTIRLTEAGREAFRNYRTRLQALLDSVPE